MKEEVNETLNQILISIASGANYVSDLAKKTGKSIPVMFRQLDSLIIKGILTKERKGKRVEYEIEWDSLAKSAAVIIKEEFESASKFIKKIPVPEIPLKEIQNIIGDIFLTKYIQKILKDMFKEIGNAGKVSYEYTRIKFNESIDMLLEIFSSLKPQEEKELLEKIPKEKKEKMEEFLKISKTHKKIKEEIDPVKKIKKKL